jgi:glc operon protein GlcG
VFDSGVDHSVKKKCNEMEEERGMNTQIRFGVTLLSWVILGICLLPPEGTAQEQTGKPQVLTLEMAERFLAAAKAKAQQEGWAMSLAVVDVAGNPVALARMDGARWMTAGVAESKAFTAATFRRPSAAVEELAKTRPQLFSSVATLVGRPLLLAGGGLPLIIGGELLGGVGVSGGTEEQDVECARAGLAAIGAE